MKTNKNLLLDHVYTEEAWLLEDANRLYLPQRDIFMMRILDRVHKGYSDLFLNVNGIFVAAELKDDKGEASAHQLQFISDVRRTNGIAGVCRTLGDIDKLVQEARFKAKG